MRNKAIFYDFDGVIKESTRIKTEAFYSLYKEHGEQIAEKAKQHHIEHGGISRFEKFKHYHKTFLNIELNEYEVAELAKQFSDIVKQKVIECDYVLGAKEAIEKLNKKYQQYIITGTPQDEIDSIMYELGLTSFFQGVFGSPSSKIEISKHILNRAAFGASEVVFIGDATTDYKAATHFDFSFILREHDENTELFRDINVNKIKDLTKLEETLEKIEQ